MREQDLMVPFWVRFTYPEDLDRYGKGPYVYDERAIATLPARVLMDLEEQMGVIMVDVMNGMRRSSALGNLCGSWLAMKLSGSDKCPPFQQYSPMIMLIEWDEVAPEDLGKDETFPGFTEVTHETGPESVVTLDYMEPVESHS